MISVPHKLIRCGNLSSYAFTSRHEYYKPQTHERMSDDKQYSNNNGKVFCTIGFVLVIMYLCFLCEDHYENNVSVLLM